MAIYRKIVVAVDFSAHSEVVLGRAFALAGEFNAEIKVLNVVDYALPIDNDYIQPPSDEVKDTLVGKAYERLDELLHFRDLSETDRSVVVGRPKLEILRFAEQMEADLIVIGAQGHHGIIGLLGSTTDRVVHKAACDVLVVR